MLWPLCVSPTQLLPQGVDSLPPFQQERPIGTATLLSGGEPGGVISCLSFGRCTSQICPRFTSTRDCFRIVGHWSSLHSAHKENLRKRFKQLSQGLVREKPLLEPMVFKLKSNDHFTHFNPFKPTAGRLRLLAEKVTFGAPRNSPPSQDLDALSDPITTCRIFIT